MPDARVNTCKREKCDFPTRMWIKSCLYGCEKCADWSAGESGLMNMSVKWQIHAPAKEKTMGKFKQVYSEEFKLQKVILWVHIRVCVCVLFCFPFLGYPLARRNRGPLSVACHKHSSLLAPSASFRKHIFGIGAKLLPLFTLYLPIPCFFCHSRFCLASLPHSPLLAIWPYRRPWRKRSRYGDAWQGFSGW